MYNNFTEESRRILMSAKQEMKEIYKGIVQKYLY